MKKHIIIFCAFSLACFVGISQEKITIKESFESNKMQWDEFYEDSYSAGIEDGKLVIKNDDENLVRSVVEFPIDIKRDFQISFDMSIKKINSNDWFGIVFNYEDENNLTYFLIKEKKFRIVNKVNGQISISRQGGIILKAGKDQKVNIKMERKSGKMIFTVNNIEVISMKKILEYSTFGCCVSGKNVLNVEEVVIEQLEESSY